MVKCRVYRCEQEAHGYARVWLSDETGVLIDADWPYCYGHYHQRLTKFDNGNHQFFNTMEGFRVQQ